MSSSARLGIARGQGDFKRIIVEGYDHAGEVEVQLHGVEDTYWRATSTATRQELF